LGYWLFHNPVKDFEKSVPGMDDRPDSIFAAGEVVKIGEDFESFSSTSSKLQGKWASFRGDQRDNIVMAPVPLLSKFPVDGPKVLWSVDLGEGHAAPAIYNGRAYLLDYMEEEKADALRCFDLVTGEETWRRSYKVHIKRNHGMSRTVPAVNEQFVVTIGPKAQVMCCDRITGDFIWGIDLVREYGSEIPFWYTGQCPLIVNNVAVLAAGGSSLIIGVDCNTGEVLWETPNPHNWQMSHSSIMPMELNGKKMFVYAAVGGICGIAADGEKAGEILWETKDFSPNVVAPSPLVLDKGKILMTAGYGAGSILFQVKEVNGTYQTETLQMFKPKNGLASEQQTGIFYKDHVFTILPKDAGSNRNRFVCAHQHDAQNILWTSGKEERFGLGPYILADGKFYILKDDGTLVIARATTERFEFLDTFKVLDGHDAWGPMAIADGKLIMRDSKTMVCLDIERK
jgi:outer membrane protein assembly factor BamB